MIKSPTTLEQSALAMARAQEHWSKRHPGPAGTKADGQSVRPWTIAITREAGTDGTTVAREVATKLGWAVYDRELVEMIGRDMGLHASLLDTVDERRRGWLVEFAEGFSSTDLSENRFVRHLVETVLSLGEHGHCVIVGRGAAQVLPAERTLRVRLVGRLADRIRDVQHKLGVAHDAAERWVREKDKERTEFVKSHFSKDPGEAEQYDLILNTSRWSIAECVEMIVQALRTAEQKA